jgi:hypothetical protein
MEYDEYTSCRSIAEGDYSETNRTYNEAQLGEAEKYIPAVPPGQLGHYDIHIITSTSAFPSLCGFTYKEFDRLFYSLKLMLKHCFPKCKDEQQPGTISKFCSRRMKLFLFTFRCKTAASFMKMEGLFGWGHTSVQE